MILWIVNQLFTVLMEQYMELFASLSEYVETRNMRIPEAASRGVL